MKMSHILVASVLLLTACGQGGAPAPEAPPPPQSLLDQVQAMSLEQQPVFAYQQLVAYQQAHPESQPPCTSPRATEARPIPDNVLEDSIYAQFKGAGVFSVQCGALISRSRFDPKEHWLVVFSPNALEPTIVNCANERGDDVCPHQIPTTDNPSP